MAEQRKNFNKNNKNNVNAKAKSQGNGGKKNQKRDNTPKNFNVNAAKTQAVMSVEGRAYEYKMSAECAKNILKNRSGNDAKKNPQQYLCEYVTEQYGLLGTCVKVLTY